jgi:O-antigen ligase
MKKNYANKLNKLLLLLVLISPIFFLTVKHWANLTVVFLSASCLFLLSTEKVLHSTFLLAKRWRITICGMFIAPLAAIAISQSLRFDFYFPNWDSPLRLVLCVPIFLVIANGDLRANLNKSICQTWLTLILPVTLIWTLFFRLIWPTSWGPNGLTTYFVDPLTFGSYSLLFSLLTLLGLSEYWSKLALNQKCLCILGIFSGIYLSLKSGSRTGWFNLPIFLCLWACFVLKPKLGFKRTALLVLVLVCFLLVILLNNVYLLGKFILIWTEISNYKWSETNADTSVGLRLSFYRMGAEYFFDRPFKGWGDLSWMVHMNRPELTKYASEFARESPKHGFHNEIITNTVRSGVWGLLATFSLFGVVFTGAIRGLRLKSTGEHRLVSLTLLVFISHLFIAGLTTEITNLVFLSSFIGFTLAVLMGEQIYLEEKLRTYHELNDISRH